MSNQPETLTTADFITTTHRISGQVQTGPRPMSDLLNDKSQSFLLAYNVYVSRLEQAGEIGTHTSVAYLSKENLNLVIVPAREARASDLGRFAAQDYEALVTLAGFEVTGKFAGPHRFDLRNFSPAALDSFFPLTEATARVVGTPGLVFNSEAILINRSRLQSLCLRE
jgi:hypothetical protein